MQNYDYDLHSIQEARNLTRQAKKAYKEMATFNESQVECIIKNMVKAAEENAELLANMAVEETGFGKAEDKVFKNLAASSLLYDEIKDMKTIGIVGEDKAKRTIDIAEPVGVVMGIIPSTNPTSTAIFKSIIALKSRNAIVFSPHPAALKCTLKAVEIMNRAAVEAGAPEGIISSVSMPTLQTTNELMKAKEVSLIIATGGPGMVKAAYSAGKPAIGVGAGNSPAYIEKTANVKEAVEMIIASKTFDNGTICASEQSIICEKSNEQEVISEFERQGGYFLTEDETKRVCNVIFKNGHTMNAKFVGRKATEIASAAGVNVPSNTKVLIGRQGGVGEEYPLSYEKLTTVLGFYTVNNWEEACYLSIDLLQNGIGHTMSLHTQDNDIVLKFSVKPASRILINTGGSQGGTGISTGLATSFTLGCGTYGGSSESDNISPKHLLNIKKVAYGIKDCRNLTIEKKFANNNCTENNYSAQNNTKKDFSNCSPAEIAKSFENKMTGFNKESNGSQKDLENLVREIIIAMNNG